MSFPNTTRYWLKYRQSDSGLTPTFTLFANATTWSPISPPTIFEAVGSGLGQGQYYFDWTWSTATDPKIIWVADGGASIPTEEIRYIQEVVGPGDTFLDEPISQVHTDVWNDSTTYTTGQKGQLVAEIGQYGDGSAIGSLFGQLVWVREQVRGDTPATSSGNNVAQVYARLGAPVGASISADLQADTATLASDIASGTASTAATLSLIAGSGFVSASNSLVAITGLVSALTPADIAGAVWTALLATYDTTPNSFGSAFSTMTGEVQRALGMMHENSVLDLTSFDVNNNLLSGRLRTYSTQADAVAAEAASPAAYTTNMIAQYAITATYTGTNLQTYLVQRTA